METGTIATFAYGALAIVGGIIGYTKSQSKISLISGSISGILLIVAGVVQLGGQPWGQYLAIGIVGLLIITFIARLIKTGKFMPAGLMIIGGLASLAAILFPILTVAT
ncbi:protein of unknown function UPF0136 [Thalassoporum mexicanum PCC 7367]|uniref:TMEM14 family protein n=1 Tax=Thalassoporum mexicanum TaxID=3457544 RepID=UPI00029FF878|nr:TMEM14 family protein [Pseudanabaena sp. PCC 7367]AFY70489.1 protein of unknown function UPF0136 [Pseudanabaena sp. PCC 7367]